MRTWSVGKVARLARLAVVVGFLAAGLGFAGFSGAAGQTVADIEVRDRLVADQEALLNVYRCMFDVDVEVVPGGCANGAPALPAKGPAPFAGIPTAGDLAVRDQLVADQEALLNVYRCQFDIDTGLIPGGCQIDPEAETTVEPEVTPEPEIQCRVVYVSTFNIPPDGETNDGICNKLPPDTRHLCEDIDPIARIYITSELIVCGHLNCVGDLHIMGGGTDDQASWYSVCVKGLADDVSLPRPACPSGYVFAWTGDRRVAFGLEVACLSFSHAAWSYHNLLEE